MQTKKTEILGQVESLNTQLATAQARIDSLQARVDELESQYRVLTEELERYVFVHAGTSGYGFTSERQHNANGAIMLDMITNYEGIENLRITNNFSILDCDGQIVSSVDTAKEYLPTSTCLIDIKAYDIDGNIISDFDSTKIYTFVPVIDYTLNADGFVDSISINLNNCVVKETSAYAGVWASGELGLEDVDYKRLMVVTVDEYMNTNIALTLSDSGTQTITVSSSDVTEISGGYQLHFDEEGMLHTMKLLEDGTMSVSLYDGNISYVCRKVTSESYNDFVGNWSGNDVDGAWTINVNEDNSVHIEVQVGSENQIFDFASENISVENGVMTLTITEADGYTFQVYAFVSNDTLVVSFPSAYVEATRG